VHGELARASAETPLVAEGGREARRTEDSPEQAICPPTLPRSQRERGVSLSEAGTLEQAPLRKPADAETSPPVISLAARFRSRAGGIARNSRARRPELARIRRDARGRLRPFRRRSRFVARFPRSPYNGIRLRFLVECPV